MFPCACHFSHHPWFGCWDTSRTQNDRNINLWKLLPQDWWRPWLRLHIDVHACVCTCVFACVCAHACTHVRVCSHGLYLKVQYIQLPVQTPSSNIPYTCQPYVHSANITHHSMMKCIFLRYPQLTVVHSNHYRDQASWYSINILDLSI